MARAVESGTLEERWAKMKAGVMTNARWHNTESRELRVYMSSDPPTHAQRRLSQFIVLVYVPTLLEIVQRNLVLEGPRHLLSLVQRVKLYCTEEEVKLLTPHLNFNGYFGQHEVVLASLLGSRDREERLEALEIVKRLRKKEKRSKRKTVRKVKNQELNLEATKLSELVDLSKAASSPPLLFKMTDEELDQLKDEPLVVDLPCSTTAVERAVKEGTAVATMVSGTWEQDMVSWNRISARERNALRFKKKDWQQM